jgi:heme exporter protein A
MTLQTHQLACTRGERQLFANINIDVSAGNALRIIGSNGTGKTSMLRILCGLAMPTDGEVRWNNQNIRSNREEFNQHLTYLGHAAAIKDDLLAWENVVVAATLSGQPVSQDDACEALEQMGLDQAVDLPARVLSQGQRRRVALARLKFCLHTPLWILDEPFVALDKAAVSQLQMTMNRHLENAGMIIFTTHQEIELNGGTQKYFDLNQGATC